LLGRIEVHATERFDVDVVLARSAGDLRIAGRDRRTAVAGHRRELQLAVSRCTTVCGASRKALPGGSSARSPARRPFAPNAQARWPPDNAPLEGVVQMRVANLAAWGTWVPPGWRLGGNLQMNAALGGRFGAPELRGRPARCRPVGAQRPAGCERSPRANCRRRSKGRWRACSACTSRAAKAGCS
jgi:translocation and assembly module TamB